jgi:hypothetical protein
MLYCEDKKKCECDEHECDIYKAYVDDPYQDDYKLSSRDIGGDYFVSHDTRQSIPTMRRLLHNFLENYEFKVISNFTIEDVKAVITYSIFEQGRGTVIPLDMHLPMEFTNHHFYIVLKKREIKD